MGSSPEGPVTTFVGLLGVVGLVLQPRITEWG